MLWFAQKAPCPRCGKDVKKVRNASEFLCPHCKAPGPWATDEQLEGWSKTQEARQEYWSIVESIFDGTSRPNASENLNLLAPHTEYSAYQRSFLALEGFARRAVTLTQDSILSREETDGLFSGLERLGVTWEDVVRSRPDTAHLVIISSINGGQLPVVLKPKILAKPHEAVHLETTAGLMKEVVLREYRSGFSGFSIPIGRTRIRYHVGASRGHSVVTGTRTEVEDSGVLTITSERAVFIGQRVTLEFPFAKLIELAVFTDGVRFHQTNRQKPALFRLGTQESEVVAALVNALAQPDTAE